MEPKSRFFMINGVDAPLAAERMDDAALDRVPFGCVRLDSAGVVLRYNAAEGRITSRSPRQVIGRHFFLDLAACGVGPLFWGRFKQGIMMNAFDEVFPFVFHHQMPETAVLVRMARVEKARKAGMWIFVRRLMPG